MRFKIVTWRSLRAGEDGRKQSSYQWNKCKYNHYADSEGRTLCGKIVRSDPQYGLDLKMCPVCQGMLAKTN